MKGFFWQFYPFSSFAYFSIGVLFSERFCNFSQSYFLIFFFFILFLVSFYLNRKRIFWVLFGFIVFFLFSTFQKHFSKVEYPSVTPKLVRHYKKHNYQIKLTPKRELKKGFFLYIVEHNKIKRLAIVKYYNKKNYKIPILRCNAQKLKIKTVEKDLGGFFRFLDKYNRFYLSVYIPKCKKLGFARDKRRFVRYKIEKLLEAGRLEGTPKNIAMGLIFGDSSYLSYDFKAKAREAGILHLFAASGLHLGIIIFFLSYIAEKVPFFNYYTSKIFPLFIAFLYIYLLNFPVSLTRAYLFASLYIFSSLFYRKLKSIDLILITSMFICFFDRESYLSLSFYLSFFAVCGILFLKSYLDRVLFSDRKNLLTENLTLSISASLGTFPVLVFFFNSYSYGSILINIVLVPLTSFILPILYCSVLMEYMGILYIKELFWVYTDLFLRLQAFLSIFLGEKFGFFRYVGNKYPILLYIYATALTLVLVSILYYLCLEDKKKKKISKIFVRFFLIFILFFFFYFAYQIKLNKQNHIKNYFASSDFFIVRTGRKVYFGGNCKYSRFKINKIIRDICEADMEIVHVEKETCLMHALDCLENLKVKKLAFTSKDIKDWEEFYPKIKFLSSIPKRKFQIKDKEYLIFYYPGIDPIFTMVNKTKKDKGRIVLMVPPWSIHKTEEWNQVKKQLGIQRGWVFVEPNEL